MTLKNVFRARQEWSGIRLVVGGILASALVAYPFSVWNHSEFWMVWVGLIIGLALNWLLAMVIKAVWED